MKKILLLFTGLAFFTFKNQAQTVADYDGNVYKTVTIGKQVWMAENLKTTHYRDGSAIPDVTDKDAWGNLTTGAYCNYDNSAGNANTYGRLYNWYAVNDSRKLCPSGWHVPTDAEWTTLTDYLGGESVAGDKLKSTIGWNSPNTGETNSSGFTALPGGYRNFNGTFYYIGYYGYWWSSTEYRTDNAWRRYMIFGYSNVNRDNYYKSLSLSVRCVRN